MAGPVQSEALPLPHPLLSPGTDARAHARLPAAERRRAQVASAHEAARKADGPTAPRDAPAAAWEAGPDHRAPAGAERRAPASAERSADGGHGNGCPCCEAMALWERAEEQLWGAAAVP